MENTIRVKPLEWMNRFERKFFSREMCGCFYYVTHFVRSPCGSFSGWGWREYGAGISQYRHAESAEAAKAACEAHWREFLFGPDGPLEKVDELLQRDRPEEGGMAPRTDQPQPDIAGGGR